MRIRKQDTNGDMVFGHGTQDYYVNTAEGVGLLVKDRLLLWQGEWFGDTTDGVPYATDVLGKSSPAVYNAVIQKRILDTPGVVDIINYAAVQNRESRKLSISCILSTEYGQITVTT